eukprot:227897_1
MFPFWFFGTNDITHLYLSFVFSIQPWQEIFPLQLIFMASYGVTAKDIIYLFVYAIVRMGIQKGFNNMVIAGPIIASCWVPIAVPIALNYKSNQPYADPSIASFRSLYFVFNFVIIAAVWIQWIYFNVGWVYPTSDKNINDSSYGKVKRLHGIIVMFVLGIMFDICNCVIFFYKYVGVSLIDFEEWLTLLRPLGCVLIGMFALLFGGSWLFGGDYPDYNVFLYCLWELNSKEYILCATMLCFYMSFVYFFGDNFWRINMFSWFKSSDKCIGIVIGTMFYYAWSWSSYYALMYPIMYSLYIWYRKFEAQEYFYAQKVVDIE